MQPTMVPAPLPKTQDPMDDEFWRRCQDGRLHFQRCENCHAWRFLPRYMCARCGSPEFEWAATRGTGSLYSWTVTHQAFHPAFAAEIPYVAALVELDEGVRMATRLLDCDRTALKLGMRVELVFREISADFRLPCFRPSASV